MHDISFNESNSEHSRWYFHCNKAASKAAHVMTLSADKMDLCVIFFFFPLSFLFGSDVTAGEWINLREEDKPKALEEFEPLKLLNISVAVSELELNELGACSDNFRQ